MRNTKKDKDTCAKCPVCGSFMTKLFLKTGSVVWMCPNQAKHPKSDAAG